MFDTKNVHLGIAPIGWCNDDMPELGAENTFKQIVSEMALAGFTGCEIGNKYPSDPVELKKQLDLRGMRIASRWFSSFLLTKPYEEVEAEFIRELDFLAAVGKKYGYDYAGELLGDKSVSVVFDNRKLKRAVPDMRTTVPFHAGVRKALDYILAHPECQKEDPDFDAYCDRVVAALEKAKQHDDISGIAVEETKLAALEDVIAHFREVKA